MRKVSTSFRRWMVVWAREASTECEEVKVVAIQAEEAIAVRVAAMETESSGLRVVIHSRECTHSRSSG